MKKLDELLKNENVRDIGTIGVVSFAEVIVTDIISKRVPGKYNDFFKVILSTGANAASYYIGKNYGEEKASEEQKNGNP